MKKSDVRQLVLWLLGVAVFIGASAIPVEAQSTTWQILPFPDSDWPGPYGQPATTNGGTITLQGQPVRTVQTFSGPLSISYDVVLESRHPEDFGRDGALILFFIPPGLSTVSNSPNLRLDMGYRNYGSDFIQITSNSAALLWSQPFSLSAQTVYHTKVDVSATGELTWIVNNLTNVIPSAIKVPYSQFQLELMGWTPGDTWYVSNFTAVPEPSTLTLVAIGLASTHILVRRRKPSR